MNRLRDRRGVGLVEFAIVAPVVLLLIFGVIDMGRAISANTSIAEAARQGARQAAANDAEPVSAAFGTPSGSCSGTVFTYSSSIGSGCLGDTAVLATVTAALREVVPATHVAFSPATDASSCGRGSGVNATPQPGWAVVCISQPSSGAVSAGAPATCGAVWAASPYPMGGALGGRQQEFTSHTYQGCYVVTVTVVASFQPWTPLVGNVVGSHILLRASTSTVAEY